MSDKEADWTLFWRQLAELRGRIGSEAVADAALVAEVMMPAFYDSNLTVQRDVSLWLQNAWLPATVSSGADAATASASMKLASPKYIPHP